MFAVKRHWTHYGLPVYAVDGAEYAVGTEKQAQKAAALAIEGRLFSFSPEFLVAFLSRYNPHLREMSDAAAEALERCLSDLQERLHDGAQPIFRALIGEELPAFVHDALRFGGRGHFLASDDGVEGESDTVQGLPRGRFAYRVG